MALIIANNATVATGMSPIVEAGLYADPIFIDGVTFTSQYDVGAAGQIQVQVFQGGRGVKPKTPGGNFNAREYTNEVININCVNGYQDAVKVPEYYANTIPGNVLMPKVLEVTQKVGGGRQESALAALVNQSTEVELDEEITAANVKQTVLKVREQARKNWAYPDIIIASINMYSKMLEAAGKEYTPQYNEDALRRGKIGYWLGYLWIDASLLDGATDDYTYREVDGEDIVVDTSDVEFVMYNWRAFSVIDKLVGLRTINAEGFFGSLVQAEIDTGFKVTNKKQCYVARKNA